MKLFVYGTLKAGGANHHLLEGCRYLGNYKLKKHFMFDVGYGFPYMIPTNDIIVMPPKFSDTVWGEVYEVHDYALKTIDKLEGHPTHYRRSLCNYNDEVAGMYVYLTNWNLIPDNAKIVENGYWPIKNSLQVIIDDRYYCDTADKLVFHMRFFDGARTPTNKDYMELVQMRSKLDLNIDDEEIFIRQCIDYGMVEEVKE